MTCDERIEALLNRAGQTISDLPDAYSYDQMIKAEDTVTAYLWFILHLTDIIDRLEWALDKTLREKAYLRAKCCYKCAALDDDEDDCNECDFDHVPDDWEEDI